MFRRWVPALFVFTLTASFAIAQFGGPRFPGGGRNRGQQNPNSTQNAPKVYGPTETLTGSIQKISNSDLVLDGGDDQIILIQIQNGTKYLSTIDKVKASDFEPGDHVTVEATRDDNNHYYSKTITMNKKGTPEEKAAATQAANSSHSSGGSGSSDDSDPDRPRLHRTNADGVSTDGQTSSAASTSAPSPAPVSAPVSSASDSDPDRPRMRRPASDSSTPQTVARSNPSVASDDSGPPALRRSPPANSSSDSSSSSAPSGGSRPSLSADDVNGVTHPPAVPLSPSDIENGNRDPSSTRAGQPNVDSGDQIIDQARAAAFSFSETLPNYVVKQLTNRYASNTATRGRTSWQPLDIVTTDLVYEDGKERYTNVMVNGKATKYIEQTGSWSEGEFASMLQAILAPATNADFRNQHSVTIVNRPAWRYDYTVSQPRSTWTLHTDGQTYRPSYTGSIWIDKATYRVLRIEIAARNLPRDFPIDTAESSIDYDFVMIGTQKVLLPADADSLSCTRGSSDCTKNHTEFHNYKKYGADSSITFGGEADSK
jgi:hypothetical protein